MLLGLVDYYYKTVLQNCEIIENKYENMFDFLKKIIKRKPMISAEQLNNIREDLSKIKEFQWIKGDNVGQITMFQDVVQDDGIVFVTFTNNTRCNISLLDEYILKLGIGDKPLEIGSDMQDAIEQSSDQVNTAVVGPAKMKNNNVISNNPIHELLKKRKINLMGISIDLELNVPPKELLLILEDSFDNAEDDVVNFVLSSISTDDIKKSVKSALSEYYKK